MKKHFLLISSLLMAAAAIDASEPKPGVDSNAAFARLKTLAGEWQADTSMGKARLSYELIAGDTALVEREIMGSMPPMLTVYHLDGDRLLLTHYCMAGNQPRMQARAFDAKSGELDFQFLDATNLKSAGAAHMHNARLRLVDNDHLAAEWDFYENGQRKSTESAQYTRVR